MIAVLAKPTLEVLRSLFVGAVQVATLHPACHQSSIGIFDDQVCFIFREGRLLFHHFFQPRIDLSCLSRSSGDVTTLPSRTTRSGPMITPM